MLANDVNRQSKSSSDSFIYISYKKSLISSLEQQYTDVMNDGELCLSDGVLLLLV